MVADSRKLKNGHSSGERNCLYVQFIILNKHHVGTRQESINALKRNRPHASMWSLTGVYMKEICVTKIRELRNRI